MYGSLDPVPVVHNIGHIRSRETFTEGELGSSRHINL